MGKILIVIDMLNDFVHKKGTLFFPAGADIIPFIKGRIEHYITNDYIIIFLCDAHDEDDKEFERFPKHAIKKTWGAGIVKELADAVADYYSLEIIPKTRYSGFYGTNLGTQLAGLAPDKVEVAGVCTSICCLMTIAGLANRNYDTTIHKNCVADFNQKAHNFSLEHMKNIFGTAII